MLSAGKFEGTSSWNNTLVIHGIFDCTKSISDSFFGLSNLVIIWTLNKDGAREGVLDSLNESVFVITEALFIDVLGKSKILLAHVIDRVQLLTTTGKRDSLSISLLASSDTNNTVSGKNFQGRWVNTFLIDDNEVFVGSIAQFSLKVDDLSDFAISEFSFRLNKLFSLFSVRPEESRVDFSLFVFKRNIQAKNVAVFHG